jgi:hypothetical protein
VAVLMPVRAMIGGASVRRYYDGAPDILGQ